MADSEVKIHFYIRGWHMPGKEEMSTEEFIQGIKIRCEKAGVCDLIQLQSMSGDKADIAVGMRYDTDAEAVHLGFKHFKFYNKYNILEKVKCENSKIF